MKYKVGSFLDGRTDDIADAIRNDPDDTILLMVDSEGGYVLSWSYLASAVYEAKARGKKIVTYTPATCMSAGFALLLMGDDIYCSPFSLMLHHNSQFINLKDRIMSFFTGNVVSTKLDTIVEQIYIPGLIDKIKKNIKLEGFLFKKPDYYLTAQEFKDIQHNVVIGFPPELYDEFIPWYEPVQEGQGDMLDVNELFTER
jgi:hypothetical protein